MVKLDLNERIALSEARWQTSEDELRTAIAEQRIEGRIVQKVITYPDGTKQTKVTREKGVDPALLRALSTHHDRRARQLNNQLAPDQSIQQVNVGIVKDFLGQAKGAAAPQLTPEAWNQQQSGAIDVEPLK